MNNCTCIGCFFGKVTVLKRFLFCIQYVDIVIFIVFLMYFFYKVPANLTSLTILQHKEPDPPPMRMNREKRKRFVLLPLIIFAWLQWGTVLTDSRTVPAHCMPNFRTTGTKICSLNNTPDSYEHFKKLWPFRLPARHCEYRLGNALSRPERFCYCRAYRSGFGGNYRCTT